MKKITAVISLCLYSFICCIPSAAKEDTVIPQNATGTTLMWRTPIYMIATEYIHVALHESGHALVGSIFGWEIEEFYIGNFGNGHVKFKDPKLSDTVVSRAQVSLMILAGPMTDRLAAVGINSLLDKYEYDMSEYTRSFLATAYMMDRFSFSEYFFMSCVYGLLGVETETQSDWLNLSAAIGGDNYQAQFLVMTVFALLHILDIVYSWDEIKKNYNRMLGRYSENKREKKSIAHFFDIMPAKDGIMIEKRWRF
jgi:hypothetical protein